MKYASDFRSIAREALRGKWLIAVIAGVIAALLGAISSEGPEVTFNAGDNGVNLGIQYADQQIWSTSEAWVMEPEILISELAIYSIAAVTVVLCIVFIIVGSIVGIGYCKFNLDLVDNLNQPEINTLFAYFSYWKTAIAASLLQMLYTLLWSLLFLIPGIIASYSYAMTSYILAENPELSASEAIACSKEMMSGNRWRLFCLQFSFIGWSILCMFTLGIGNMFLTPYVQAATAAFYREVSGTEYVEELPVMDIDLNMGSNV